LKTATLFLIPTILADNTAENVLSPQIKAVISQTNYYFVENVRTARRFISSLKLGISIDSLTFFELNKDTPLAETQAQMQILLDGNDAGIISEAGCPGIADPGNVAVRIAHQKNIQVVPLVGPSAIFMALMASGMNGQSFVFHGYLPIEKNARQHKIKELEGFVLKSNQTQIFMETPYRNNALLDDILLVCQATTQLCIASNVSASDEFIKTKSIKYWQNTKPDLHKKPTVFLLG
jgi:16S rRNA (cytidine1402-2'-O)-methyltransferase